MNAARRQRRILYRQFLFRLMDVELLSSSAQGDSHALLGQFGSLLVFASVLLSWGAISVGNELHRGGHAASYWAAERFLVSLTMFVVGVFALLSWDAAFPDRRDVLVLSPLPIRPRTLFAAKIAASGTAMSLIVAALHCLSGFLWPVVLTPSGAGAAATLRFIAAFWIAMLAAGAFIYCVVLGAQAIAAQLPRKWYLRLSPILQISGLALFLGVLCLQPADPRIPTHWFMALLSELSGVFPAQSHAALAPLARRAVAGLVLALAIAGLAFLLSYVRTLRKIVEEPDAAPSARGRIPLPSFGAAPQTALARFILRTLLRSRPHRVVLSFYLGGGFALAALYVQIMMDVMRITGDGLLHRVNVPMLVASIVLLAAAWLGVRTVFSLPLDLRANWLFRVAPVPVGAARLAAIRRALLAATLAPVAILSAALFLCFWPWIRVVQHLVLLALTGSILADLSLREFPKLPFTCSWLPGKSKAHMVFWFGVIPAMFAVHKLVDLELSAMESPWRYAALLAALSAAACLARRMAETAAARAGSELRFEEVPGDQVLALNLDA